MQVKHITTSIMVTATCWIHQTGRIILFRPFSNFNGLKLSPSSLNGTRYQCKDKNTDSPLFLSILCDNKLLIRLNASFPYHQSTSGSAIAGCGHHWHVLPHTIPSWSQYVYQRAGLYFNMFTDHIITKIFCLLNVIQQSFIRREPYTDRQATNLDQAGQTGTALHYSVPNVRYHWHPCEWNIYAWPHSYPILSTILFPF